MRVLRPASIALALTLSTVAVAEEFDGTVPLQCKVEKAFDCLPDGNKCNRLKPEDGQLPVFGIDVTNKQIRSPFRTNLLSVLYTTSNADSLVLQGADLQFAWSALIHKTTGQLRVAIADRKGTMVAFGKCQKGDAASMASPTQ